MTPDPPDRSSGANSTPASEARDQDPGLPERRLLAARRLVDEIDSRFPSGYRRAVLRALLPLTLAEVPASGRGGMADAPDRVSRPPSTRALDTDRYVPILAAPGRTLLKALAALEMASSQLGITWMSPTEIERLLKRRLHLRSIYRSNLSSALSTAQDLVERRGRGRGYEYRITRKGRRKLERELAILGP